MKDKIANTPEIRFKGFTDDWTQRKLGEVISEKIANGIMNRPGKNELNAKHRQFFIPQPKRSPQTESKIPFCRPAKPRPYPQAEPRESFISTRLQVIIHYQSNLRQK